MILSIMCSYFILKQIIDNKPANKNKLKCNKCTNLNHKPNRRRYE